MESVSRFFDPPASSFFLFGPRGTGKSTWARAAFPGALYVDLLSPSEYRALSARPERLEEQVHALPDGQVVVIDEVQKVPDLLLVVHRLIEQKRGWRFVLTGSSARTLKRAGVDLLAGRAVVRSLHPFMLSELGAEIDLDRALTCGLLPVVLDSPDPEDTLSAYAGLYVREEVQLERLVRRVGDFARFLEAISFSHAAPLNVTSVARECGVGRKTVEGYVGILEDLLLAFRLPVFTRRARRATISRPRFFLFDAGVFRALRPSGPLDRAPEIGGAALEGLVAQHLRAWNAYGGDHHQLFYWRTRGGSEVDFVVYGPGGFWAIEVKSSREVRPSDLRGLRVFAADYPECQPLLLYRGPTRALIGGIPCLPCEPFLRALIPGAPLPA